MNNSKTRYCTRYGISIHYGCAFTNFPKKRGYSILTEHVCFTVFTRGSVNVLKNCKVGLRTLHQWQVNSQRQWNVVNGGTYDKFATIDDSTSNPVWSDLALNKAFFRVGEGFFYPRFNYKFGSSIHTNFSC